MSTFVRIVGLFVALAVSACDQGATNLVPGFDMATIDRLEQITDGQPLDLVTTMRPSDLHSPSDADDICPGWRVTPAVLAFGNVKVGKTSVSSFSLTNTGSKEQMIIAMRLVGDQNEFRFNDPGHFWLKAGEITNVAVALSPLSVGPKTAEVDAIPSEGTCTIVASITGSGN